MGLEWERCKCKAYRESGWTSCGSSSPRIPASNSQRYPDNLKSKAVLWLWELRDIAIIGVGALISVFAMAQLGFLPPVVITAAYAFLSIRLEDTSILDFLRYAIRYFLLGQQTYAWGLCNPSTDRSDRK